MCEGVGVIVMHKKTNTKKHTSFLLLGEDEISISLSMWANYTLVVLGKETGEKEGGGGGERVTTRGGR